MTPDQRARVRALNDRLRQTGCGGQIMATVGVMSRSPGFIRRALSAMTAFSEFTPDNDPFEEHDFGSLVIDGERLFWKIAYYDETLTAGAEDPADPRACRRVLTLMLAEEY